LKLRYEKKFKLDAQTAQIFKKRVAGALMPDSHSNGQYWVHNIYFDDMYYTAYNAKQNSAFFRDKYRIRYYNGDLSYVRLEHKHKEGELSSKRSVLLTRDEYDELAAGGLPPLFFQKEPLGTVYTRLYQLKRLRPTVEFTYFREAYTHPAGDVRITFDSNIPGGAGIIELKYSRFLPCFISELLTGLPLMQVENSKYCLALIQSKRGLG
jgi:hypothetical protein